MALMFPMTAGFGKYRQEQAVNGYHVRECVEALYLPEGGLALKLEINYDIPMANIAALFDAVRKYRCYKK